MARPILKLEREVALELQQELFGDGNRCTRCGDPVTAGVYCECYRERHILTEAQRVQDTDWLQI